MGQDQQGSWSGTGMAVHELEAGAPNSFAHMVTENPGLSLSGGHGPMGRGWRLQVSLLTAIKTY